MIERLFDRYFTLVREFGGAMRRQFSTSNRVRVAVAERYLAWCSEKEIDPLLFMRYRIQSAVDRHGVVPGFNSLVSDDLAREYERTGAAEGLAVFEQHEKHVYDAVGREYARLWSFVRDLMSPPTEVEESFRQRNVGAGNAGICRFERQRVGLGYDPRSRVCPTCPERAGCAADSSADAGLDTGALRRGEFAKLPERARLIAERSIELHQHVVQIRRRTPRDA